MSRRMSPAEIERGLVAQGVPRKNAKRAADRALIDGNPLAVEPPGVILPSPRVTIREPTITATRGLDIHGHHFCCTIPFPPRTKKNHGRAFGIKQSAAYVRYKNAIVTGFLPLITAFDLPLPDHAYNLEAIFYVDARGKSADLIGLLQGLADALENAGVVSNDWWFRSFDRSRVVTDDPSPRVDVMIAPGNERSTP